MITRILYACRHAAVLLAGTSCVFAGPLKEAAVNQIVNEVKLVDPQKGARPALVKDVVHDEIGVRTGIQSRTELLFQDKTLTRLGAETFFSFKAGTRDLTLDRGTLLLQVPKGLGGARIRAGSVTASITGTTIMIENLPGKDIKVLVLEGSLRLALNKRVGEAVRLTPGKMVIMKPDARSIPQPVTVDLRTVIKTSSLIDPKAFKGNTTASVAPLPSMGLIAAEIGHQDVLKQKQGLIATNLVIPGNGTEVVAASDTAMQKMESGTGNVDDVRPNRPATNPTVMLGQLPGPDPRVAAIVPLSKPVEPALPSLGLIPDTGALFDLGPTTLADAPSASAKDAPSQPTSALSAATGATTDTVATVVSSATSTVAAVVPAVTAPLTETVAAVVPAVTAPVTETIAAVVPAVTAPVTETIAAVVPAVTAPVTETVAAVIPAVTAPLTETIAAVVPVVTTPVTETIAAVVPAVTAPVTDTIAAVVPAVTAPVTETIAAVVPAVTAPVTETIAAVVPAVTAPVTETVAAVVPAVIAPVTETIAAVVPAVTAPVTETVAAVVPAVTAPVTETIASVVPAVTAPVTETIAAVVPAVTAPVTETVAAVVPAVTAPVTETIASVVPAVTAPVTETIAAVVPAVTAPLTETVADVVPAVTAPVTETIAAVVPAVTSPVQETLSSLLSPLTSVVTTSTSPAPAPTASPATDPSEPLTADLSLPAVDQTSMSVTDVRSRVSGQSLNGTGSNGSLLAAPKGGRAFELRGPTISIAPNGIAGVNLNGGNASLSLLQQGGDGGRLLAGTPAAPIAGDIIVTSPISAATGANSTLSPTGGKGGSVQFVSNGHVQVDSQIKVSDSAAGRASRTGGTIAIQSQKTTGAAITISNSGQLLALLDAAAPGPGGTIKFVSAGGNILVDGGTVRADRGNVEMINTGTNGVITLRNANVSGDVVKIAAMGPNGQLIIGGGTLSADTTLKLYGGATDGAVRFIADTTLGGDGLKIIAGRTVTIDDGRLVTVQGSRPASVFTDHANYTGSGGNGSTTGHFGGAGATTQPFGGRPKF